MKHQRIVATSGGKDSTALYLLMLEKGKDFRAVYADTGFESPITRDYVLSLPDKTGGPKVEVIQADLSHEVLRKRGNLPRKWSEAGISGERIAQALAILWPTGNPFLDLSLARGGFPSMRRRFCTQELKLKPFADQIYGPLLDQGIMPISFQGIRREESALRAKRKTWAWADMYDCLYRICLPLLNWTVADVMEIHARHAIKPNPLYEKGFERVGCWPCVNSGKKAIKALSVFDPRAIDQIDQWEQLVGACSPGGSWTFFYDKDLASREEGGIRERVKWANTSRGGKQYELLTQDEIQESKAAEEWHSQCSIYGVCE